MIDVRDETLAGLLEDSVREIDPSPDERLTEIRRRGASRKVTRWVTLGAALAVSLGALVLAGLALRMDSSTPTSVRIAGVPPGWGTHYEGRLGLAFDHPEAWPVIMVDTTCRVTLEGVLLLSDPLAFGDAVFSGGDGCVSSKKHTALPEDLVVVALTRQSGGPLSPPDGPDTSFPVSPDDALPGMRGFWPNRLSALSQQGVVTIELQVAGDRGYAVRLFRGPNASPESLAVAEQIISSIGLHPCASGLEPLPGLLSCHEAIAAHPATGDLRIIDASIDSYGGRRVWAFVSEPQNFYISIGGDSPRCSEGARKILIDARTGAFIATLGVGRFVPCASFLPEDS